MTPLLVIIAIYIILLYYIFSYFPASDKKKISAIVVEYGIGVV